MQLKIALTSVKMHFTTTQGKSKIVVEPLKKQEGFNSFITL